MDPKYPLRDLKLVASSQADDLGFVALADISQLAANEGWSGEYRLIGGHMLTLHVRRWGLGSELYRETTDVDFGLATMAIARADPTAPLQAESYKKVGGCRFEKRVPEHTEPAIIDVLVPAYRTRARKSVPVGSLNTTEVPGLATALQRPASTAELEMTRLNGEELAAEIDLPDEQSSFVLKVLAYEHRNSEKDAVDVWRCLEILHRAGLSVSGETGEDFDRARVLVTEGFERVDSSMMSALCQQRRLSKTATQKLHTRIKALLRDTVS